MAAGSSRTGGAASKFDISSVGVCDQGKKNRQAATYGRVPLLADLAFDGKPAACRCTVFAHLGARFLPRIASQVIT